jgi:hypothetical protein
MHGEPCPCHPRALPRLVPRLCRLPEAVPEGQSLPADEDESDGDDPKSPFGQEPLDRADRAGVEQDEDLQD